MKRLHGEFYFSDSVATHSFFFISTQLSLTDEQFPVDEELGRGSLTTSVSDLATEARQIAQVTMCTYV